MAGLPARYPTVEGGRGGGEGGGGDRCRDNAVFAMCLPPSHALARGRRLVGFLTGGFVRLR